MDLDNDELKATREKSADEMFKELGYSFYDINSYYTELYTREYEKKTLMERGTRHQFIDFRLNKKELYVYNSINMQELQAINKKCKELRVVRMNDKLKVKILHSIEDILEENKSNYQDTIDLFNLTKIIENYEELEPDIKNMLNKKARKDKWGERYER
jgi:hypothetical protein